MTVPVLQIRKKGSLTLPAEFRQKYGFSEGDILTLIDLGDGAFLLTPKVSLCNRLGDRVAEAVAGYNVTLDDILSTLDEEREHYYREHYAAD